jgi:hypothetical protein
MRFVVRCGELPESPAVVEFTRRLLDRIALETRGGYEQVT